MSLESIISITGKPGLYKIISQAKNGLVVESLLDGKRMPVYASEKVSALEDISVYTHTEDLPLNEVYQKLLEKTEGKVAIDHKSTPEELRSYFKEVVENYDQERVYNSDLKKIFQWYNILVKQKILKPAKKEAPKKKAVGKAGAATKEKAPAKKATTTKKKAPAKKIAVSANKTKTSAAVKKVSPAKSAARSK